MQSSCKAFLDDETVPLYLFLISDRSINYFLKCFNVVPLLLSRLIKHFLLCASVTSKNLPNVYKSCPKMISLEKFKILTPLQKLPKNVTNLGKLIVAKGFEKLPKVQ